MADEVYTTTETPQAVPSHTTVIHETRSGGSGTGIVLAVVLLIAVIGGLYLFSQNSASEAAKNNAVASAAKDVGKAATNIGDAAKDAVNTDK